MINPAKRKIISGVFWNGLQLLVNQGFAFIIRLVLAKVLFPEQFGIIGMALIFTGFVQVCNDLGMGAALVQKKESNLTAAHYHTAFWTGLGWSFFLYLVMSFLMAPLAASFFKEPLLVTLIPVISIGILSSPVNLVHKAQLTKAMNFKKMGFIDTLSNTIAGCLSLALAFSGAGVWSLAFNSVASLLIAMPLYFKATGWRPKLLWDKQAFQEIFGFGIYTTGTSLVNYGINNIDYLLIGKLLTAQALGTYTFAFMLTDTFRSRMMAVVNNVMYPVYGKNQSDLHSLKYYYLKVIKYNSLVVFPVMVFLLALGEPFVLHFFGDKWAAAILPLEILALSVMVHMMVNSNTALIRGMGRPGLELKLQIIKGLIFIPMLVFGILQYGIIGGAWAVLINKIIAVLISQYTFNNLLALKISPRAFFEAIKIPWLAAVVSYSLSYVLYTKMHLPYPLVGIILLLSYGGICWFYLGEELKSLFKTFRHSRKVITSV